MQNGCRIDASMDDSVSGNMKAILAVLGSSVAIFWPGALTFGFPGVMAQVWQDMFHVGRGATGITIFFMLAAVGVFMFLVGRWQEHEDPHCSQHEKMVMPVAPRPT